MMMQIDRPWHELPPQLRQFCQQHPAGLISFSAKAVKLAVSCPVSDELQRSLEFYCQCPIEFSYWPLAQLEAWQQQELTEQPASYLTEQNQASSAAVVEPHSAPRGSFSASDWLDKLFILAIQQRASDLHFEPQPNALRIRMRIDGVLQLTHHLTPEQGCAAITRLKILANVDIAENRRPQDGQLSVEAQQQRYSLRLSTLPTYQGEKLVLRLLPPLQQALTLDRLGFSDVELQQFNQALATPQGLILVTGPTGSGKSATLYSAMLSLNLPTRNLCSVEDPIEVHIPGINQTQINPKAGLDFAQILRALLRQDPDVIMIGEIRDRQTAESAVNAAQTGHLVLSTLHTNSTCETINRLTQMDIPSYLLASTLKLVVAQRLLRKLCVYCRQPSPASVSVTLTPQWQACGCNHCFSGYYGRIALFELLPINSEMASAIAQRHSVLQLSQLAERQGVVSLFAAGVEAVAKGLTSFDELLRVLGREDEIA